MRVGNRHGLSAGITTFDHTECRVCGSRRMTASGALRPQLVMATGVASTKLKFPRSRGASFAIVC
ncbi:DUF6255 family natural product biosynthesis protein [Brevundimonas sp. Leaf280]|uniref:DUF6255 family natural product biosynthesis protein n=1 Tax=Brevundimonas sp. Leaf280 TaxID=1736320 RepID=UPI0035155AB0